MPRSSAPEVSRSPGRRAAVVAGWVGLFGLAVVLPLLRQQGTPPWDVFWAEDGAVYFRDAAVDGFGAVLRGYQGYVQLLPRLLAVPTAWLPISAAPAYAALSASVVNALIAAFVFRATRGYVATTVLRLVVAGSWVVAPVLGWEGAGNWTNLIWPVLGAVPWAIVSQRTGRIDTLGRVVLVVLAPLCQPLAFVFVPLALLVAWRRRTPASYAVVVGLVAGLVAQGLLMVRSVPRHEPMAFAVRDLAKTVSVSFFGSFLVGEKALPHVWFRAGNAAAVAFVLGTIAVFALLLWAASARARRLALVWIGYALLLVVAPLISNGTEGTRPLPGLPLAPIERYVTVPMFLFVGALAMLVDAPDASRDRLVNRVARPLVVAQIVVVSLVGFRLDNPRSTAPSWAGQVTVAREACAATGADEIGLGIAPVPWGVDLPCRRVS